MSYDNIKVIIRIQMHSIIVQIIWVCPRYNDCVTIPLNYIEIKLYHQNQIVTLVSLSFWGSSNTPPYVYVYRCSRLCTGGKTRTCFGMFILLQAKPELNCKMPSFKHVFRVGITAVSRTKHNPIYCMNSMLYHSLFFTFLETWYTWSCSARPLAVSWLSSDLGKNKQTHNSQLMGFLTV